MEQVGIAAQCQVVNKVLNQLARCASTNMLAIQFFFILETFLQVKGDCLAGGCEMISLDVHGDAVQDTEFVGHVFHNSVTLNPVQCYTWCIQDCRCLSLNYKENNQEKYCELNEGNHFTNKSSLKNSPNSSYYILKREVKSKPLNLIFYSCFLPKKLIWTVVIFESRSVPCCCKFEILTI